jgi:hypothetical protein
VLVKRTTDSSGFVRVTAKGKKNTGFCFIVGSNKKIREINNSMAIDPVS